MAECWGLGVGWGWWRGGGFACWIDFDKLGTCEICRNLCSKVGFCFIISTSRSLAWLPCCNSISFSGSLSHAAFFFFFIIPERNRLKRERFPAVSSDRSDAGGDDVTEAQPQAASSHTPSWFNVPQLHPKKKKKSLSTRRRSTWHLP